MGSTDSALTPRSEDFNDWYNRLVLKADLADYGPVRGTMIIKPYGWALWQRIQDALDERFKAAGVENAAFPMLIPMSYLEKEAKHIEGFAPELAVVTHGGGQELSEPLVVRPTSETIIGHAYARWIQSYRDLPVLINLWNSVVRWEMRTKLFLRTLEFYWQEGHTAHASKEEALERTLQMLEIYADVAVNEAAMPVIQGEKSENERFAGAVRTYTIEAMMGDGKALQSGTSHFFGQNFSKAFEIQFTDQNNTIQNCWTTSWGLSTRFVGGIIMTHGDDRGLVLPPRLAPYQVVVVPIVPKESDKEAVMTNARRTVSVLSDSGIRVKLDDREHLSPGYKYHDWELRGVPIRLEIGPRDIQNHSVMLARRDMQGRDSKQRVSTGGLVDVVHQTLDDIQDRLLARAREFQEDHTLDVSTYGDEFNAAIRQGFARVWWDGNGDDENAIKEETKATLRCLPLEQPDDSGICFYTGRKTNRMAIFGRSY